MEAVRGYLRHTVDNPIINKSEYKVALLTVTQMDIALTALAGVLRSNGIPAKIISLQTDENGHPTEYSESVVKETLNLLKGIDFLGISVADLFFKRALFIARRIKEYYPHIIIVLGGIHAELYPEECLKESYIDGVCVGDGYQAILDLVNKWHNRHNEDISNMLIKLSGGSIKKCIKFDFFDNTALDRTAIPDYSYEHYWMLINDHINWMAEYDGVYSCSHHQIGHKDTFVVSFMTGCIHNCLYCNNWARFLKHQQYAKKKLPRVRYKSPQRMIAELSEILKLHQVKFLNIMDNDFFIRPISEIHEFSKLYKEYIGLPFYIMGSPDTITEEGLLCLNDAGLVELNIGLQTINRVNKVMYHRDYNLDDDQIIAKTKMVNRFVKQGKIDVFYDFIIFNAASTKEDLIDTINFIRQIPIPFDQVVHHLTLGPEVSLYHKFKNEDMVLPRDLDKMYESNYHEFKLEEYQSFPHLYLNLIMEWMGGRHDEKQVGRLPRDPNHFVVSDPIFQLKKYFPDRKSVV